MQRDVLRGFLTGEGLSIEGWRVLSRALRDREVPVRELPGRLRLDAGVAGGALSEAERRGLVRSADRNGTRVVRATSEGVAFAKRAAAAAKGAGVRPREVRPGEGPPERRERPAREVRPAVDPPEPSERSAPEPAEETGPMASPADEVRAVQEAPTEPPLPQDAIRTDGLTKVYPGDIRAVDDLYLDVRPGEIFGLLGPNGAGKTTTVGMLTTRVVPTRGRAWVGGIDVIDQPALAKQAMGIVPQTNTLDRSLSVYENLYVHGRLFGMSARRSKDAAGDLLDRFYLAERAKFEVDTLSGGMAQRLMVARAIMHRPQVLFLDEPTAGLDPQSRIALWEILGELHGAGQTILLTTHYMEEADQLCDRVAIMDHGRILALGTPGELKRSSGADTVVHLHAAKRHEELVEHMEGMRGATGARLMPDGTVHVWLQGVDRTVPRVIAHAERGRFDITDIGVSEPTLETVFIRLTGKELRE